ncbi:MAG: purine-nucleoside phosphorylase [Armatimonadetes bacterium]|nr:purine-nucleoside phosphorylase [Armatimonadota bacterium]
MTPALRVRLAEAAAAVGARVPFDPTIGIVLGSGLGALAGEIAAAGTVPYADIPHFPRSTVAGHAGRLVLGTLSGKRVAALQGRAHFYEGYAMHEVVFPVRVLWALGCRTLIVSNAAGGLNPAFAAGDLMILTDHLNFQGTNPLIGLNDESLGPRFPDLGRPYDPDFVALARSAAAAEAMPIREGVYVAVTGPSYETHAELRMMRGVGGDAVGMSTAPEVIAARHLGMRVLGLSAIANVATGDQTTTVTHEEVLAASKALEPRFVRLVRRIVGELP